MSNILDLSVVPIWEDFSSVKLDETETKDEGPVVKEVQLLRTGQWDHPKYGKLVVTSSTLDEIVKNFADNVRGVDLSLDAGHKNQEESYGWIRGLKRNGSALVAKVEFTDLGRDAIKNKRFRYISAELSPKWVDDETGSVYRNVLLGAGLTNRPYIRRMVALDEDIQFSEVICLSESAAGGRSGCMLVPERARSTYAKFNNYINEDDVFEFEEDDMPDYGVYDEDELDAMVEGEYDVEVDDQDILDARESAMGLEDLAEEISDEDAAEILSQLSDEEIAELDTALTEMEAVALSESNYDYMYDDSEAYEFDEDLPDEGSMDGLTLAQIEGVIAAKESIDALAFSCGDEALAIALSETSAMLDDVLEGAKLSTLLSESDDPAVVMLAEQFLQTRNGQHEMAMAFAEEQTDELIDVLLHDDETGEATILPQQAEIAKEILLSAPPTIRALFCEFLQYAPPVMSFDEYGTAYVDSEDLPVHHPDSSTMQILSLAEQFEDHGYSSDDALRMARMRLYGM